MENEMQRKVKNGAKTLRILSQITFWVAIAATAVTIILGILMKLFPETFAGLLVASGGGSLSINMGILRYHVPADLSYREVVRIHEMMGFVIGVSCALGALFLRQLIGILREVESGRPFSPSNAKRLGSMGVIVIVSSIVYRIGQAAALSTPT